MSRRERRSSSRSSDEIPPQWPLPLAQGKQATRLPFVDELDWPTVANETRFVVGAGLAPGTPAFLKATSLTATALLAAG